MQLRRSDDLMAGRFVHAWTHTNGSVGHSTRADVDHCFYHGRIVGEPRSIATAHTCGEGIEASVRTEQGEHFMVLPGSRVAEVRDGEAGPRLAARRTQEAGPGQLAPHVVFRTSDHQTPECPISPLAKTAEKVSLPDVQEEHRKSRRLQDFTPTQGCTCLSSWSFTAGGQRFDYPSGGCHNPDQDPAGPWCFTQDRCGIGGSDSYVYCEQTSGGAGGGAPSPPTSTVSGCSEHVELLIANDHTQLARVGGDRAAAQEHALLVANGVKEIYGTMDLQICVTLVAVYSFSSAAEEGALNTPASETIDEYLNRWSDWRAANSVQGFGGVASVDLRNDNGVILTNVDRSGSTQGLGWVGTMCRSRLSTSVVEENRNGIWQYTAETLAHEMGHNFGSHHDGVGEASNCDESAFIMAAVGCGNCGFTSFKAWSSCSHTYIQDTLQGLQNTPSNCLVNNPRTPVCGSGEGNCASCGDFIVSGDEECDVGPAGSSLCYGSDAASPCTFRPGVVCSDGECCDTSTGQYKAAGNLCRASMHQCDLADYCSGSSATCDGDVFKADGTPCTESGPGSQCYVGSCIGLDGQCGNAFQGYSGTWVAAARNGIDATCTQTGDGCGELQCTNTEWDNYCQSFECPSGFLCNLGDGQQIAGPATHNYCNCDTKSAMTSVTVPVLIADGTACGPAGADMICMQNACVARPAPVQPPPPPPPPPPPAAPPPPPAVNCAGVWGAWSTCSATCGGGTQEREYTVTVSAAYGGSECATASGSKETRACGTAVCDRDCEGEWGAWGSCSTSCGPGLESRDYTVTVPAAGDYGASCPVADGASESRACELRACVSMVAVDCVGAWGSWGTCSAECDGGIRTRTFSVSQALANGGAACVAHDGATESVACNTAECPQTTCRWTNDGACDEPLICPVGTDTADCDAAAAEEAAAAAAAGGCVASDPSSCGDNGACARDLSGVNRCVCDPGWSGAACDTQAGCGLDCASLNRAACVSPTSCGPCLPGHSFWGPGDTAAESFAGDAACDLLPLSATNVLAGISANRKADGSSASSIADGDVFSHWISGFSPSMTEDEKPQIVLAYQQPVTITNYAIVSGNSHPAEDPKDWKLLCSRLGDPEMREVDVRIGELFDSRHQTRHFALSSKQTCDNIALRVLGIRDAHFQGGATIGANTTTVAGSGGSTTATTVQETTEEFHADLQIAEVQLFRSASVSATVDRADPLQEEGESSPSIPFMIFVVALVGCGVFAGVSQCRASVARRSQAPPPLPPRAKVVEEASPLKDMEEAVPPDDGRLDLARMSTAQFRDAREAARADELEVGTPPPPIPSKGRVELARSVSSQSLEPASLSSIHAQFDAIDTDGDGTLSKEEIEQCLLATLGYA